MWWHGDEADVIASHPVQGDRLVYHRLRTETERWRAVQEIGRRSKKGRLERGQEKDRLYLELSDFFLFVIVVDDDDFFVVVVVILRGQVDPAVPRQA